MNINDKMRSKKSYLDIVVDVVKSIFKVDLQPGTKKIYVDVNSTFSIIYAGDTQHINTDVTKGIVVECVQEIISKAQVMGAQVVFLYTAQKSILHTSIYPDWCKERYKRDMISKPDYLTAVLKYLKELSNKNAIVKVVDVQEFHPAHYIYVTESHMGAKSDNNYKIVVLSKDPVFFGIPYDGVEFYSGVMLSINDKKSQTGNYIRGLNISRRYALYYLTIVGDHRNEYKGMTGIGPTKGLHFVESNAISITLSMMGDNVAYQHKEFFEKHYPMYDMVKGLSYLKTLGVDINRIKNL